MDDRKYKLNSQPVSLYTYRGSEPDDGQWADDRCGTYAGWNAHKYLGEEPCPPCKRAHADYMREWRLRTGRTRTIRVALTARQLAALSQLRQ
jgi:hypothetical protein